MIKLKLIANKINIESGWEEVMSAIHAYTPPTPNDYSSQSEWMSKSQVLGNLDCMGSFKAKWGNTPAGKLGRATSFMDYHLDFVFTCLRASDLEYQVWDGSNRVR